MSASQQGPITEFAFLNLLTPTTLQTPIFVSTLFSAARAQSQWSGYPIQFFYSHGSRTRSREGEVEEIPTDTVHPPPTTTLYLISGWETVEAHNEWIASPKNQEIMKFFGSAGMMEFGGLAHLDINFTKMAFEECDTIVWRKRSGEGSTTDVHERKVDGGEGCKCESIPGLSVLSTTATNVPQRAAENLPRPARQTAARFLWSHSGTAIDGLKETYEFTAYSDGELPELSENNLVIHKWIPESDA